MTGVSDFTAEFNIVSDDGQDPVDEQQGPVDESPNSADAPQASADEPQGVADESHGSGQESHDSVQEVHNSASSGMNSIPVVTEDQIDDSSTSNAPPRPPHPLRCRESSTVMTTSRPPR